MKFLFTGTGTSQGVPVIACGCEVCRSADPRDKRLRSSGLLMSDESTLVFDTGPDFRQQMLAHGIRKLDAVVFTHSHKDHTGGLDDVRPFNYLLRMVMPVFGTQATLDHLKKEYYYVFDHPGYPGLPELALTAIAEGEAFQAAGIELLPIPVRHGRMAVLGFRAGPFAYITDANYISPESKALLRGVEYLVLNALQIERHHSHFTLAEALEQVAEIGPRQAWLTHISHRLGLHAQVSETLPAGVALAYDGLELAW